jgi:phage anti-repressor protein
MDTKKTNGIPEGVRKKTNWKWVDARTLHEELEHSSFFNTWIKRHIKICGLIEGEDYEVYFQPRVHSRGNNPRKDYYLSPEAVEKIKVVHNNRKYIKDTKISTFKLDGRTLNVFYYNGELYFFGVDICKILEIPARHFSDSKNERKLTVITSLFPNLFPVPYAVANEWELLWFVCRLKKNGTKAVEVSKWLINEALPKIRKAYATPHSMLDRFRQFIKPQRRQPEILPLCDRPGFPINLPAKEAQDERA